MFPDYWYIEGWHNFRLFDYDWNALPTQLTNNYEEETCEFCDDTLAPLNNCTVPLGELARAQYDAAADRWMMLKIYTNRIVAYNKVAKSISTVVELPFGATAFNYRKTSGIEYVDYCSDDGTLNSYNMNSLVNVVHDLKINGLTCSGYTLNYNLIRHSLIFPARHNGLSAVIEFKL